MSGSILFVVGQSSTIAYLAPVWQRWLQRGTEITWRVVATEAAMKRIELENLDGLPLMPVADASLATLNQSLGDWRPECLVMSATSAPIERTAREYAHLNGKPTARIIDTWYGYRRRLSDENGKLCLPEKLIVIDEPAAQAAMAEDIPRDIIEILGQPAWEHIQILPPADRRDVLFISQPIRHNYGMSLGYTEQTVWEFFVETMQSYPDLFRHVYYSAHPDDDMPPPEMTGVEVVRSGAATLAKVGRAVGMFSSLLTDALLAGRHVISFQPNNSDSIRANMGRRDFVPHALTPDELAAALTATAPDVGEMRDVLRDSCDRVEKFCLNFCNGVTA
jgi:hypothetical protein